MSDKERIEDIELMIGIYNSTWVQEVLNKIADDFFKQHAYWILEQAKLRQKQIVNNTIALQYIDEIQFRAEGLKKDVNRWKTHTEGLAEELYQSELQNKIYRKYLEKIADVENGFDPLAVEARMAIEEVEALESDCIHCNGKGFNGLDWCTQCNQGEVLE